MLVVLGFTREVIAQRRIEQAHHQKVHVKCSCPVAEKSVLSCFVRIRHVVHLPLTNVCHLPSNSSKGSLSILPTLRSSRSIGRNPAIRSTATPNTVRDSKDPRSQLSASFGFMMCACIPDYIYVHLYKIGTIVLGDYFL